jgi:hypothetical protein
MIVLSMWNIVIVGEAALGCWCPSYYVEWCGVVWLMADVRAFTAAVGKVQVVVKG